MRYWEDMQSKYGFSDGNAMPDGVEVYRTIYIRAVNRLAEQLGSSVRAIAYDRAGLHNWCQVLFHRINDLQVSNVTDLTQHTDIAAETAAPDEPMEEAVRQAVEYELDSFVRVSVEVDTEFEQFMTDLQPIDEDGALIVQVNGQPQHIYPSGRVRLTCDINLSTEQVLEAGSEFVVAWVDHHPRFIGLADQPDAQAFTIVLAEKVIVTAIPADIRSTTDNAEPIPPYHLRNQAGETLDEYGAFYDWNSARNAAHRALRELGRPVQVFNGYDNPIISFDISEESD